MCFRYDQSMGTYLQSAEMYNGNSVFETEIDITGVTEKSIAQFTVHRNSYRSREGQDLYKFAISLIYDKKKNDAWIHSQPTFAGMEDNEVVMMHLRITDTGKQSFVEM